MAKKETTVTDLGITTTKTHTQRQLAALPSRTLLVGPPRQNKSTHTNTKPKKTITQRTPLGLRTEPSAPWYTIVLQDQRCAALISDTLARTHYVLPTLPCITLSHCACFRCLLAASFGYASAHAATTAPPSVKDAKEK